VFSAKDTAEQLAEVFREQVLYLARSADVELSEREQGLISAWILGRGAASRPSEAAAPAEPAPAAQPAAAPAPSTEPEPARLEAADLTAGAKPVPQTSILRPSPVKAAAAKPVIAETVAARRFAARAIRARAGEPAGGEGPGGGADAAAAVGPDPAGSGSPPAPPPSGKPQLVSVKRPTLAERAAVPVRAAGQAPAAKPAAASAAPQSAGGTAVPPAGAASAASSKAATPPQKPAPAPAPAPDPDDMESSILAAIAEAVDVLVEDRSTDNVRPDRPVAEAQAAEPGASPAHGEADDDEIGDEIQRILASYSQNRDQRR
jgi:hypothetical protein